MNDLARLFLGIQINQLTLSNCQTNKYGYIDGEPLS